MEVLVARYALHGAESDSDSVRSDISETVCSVFQRRPGSGRRKAACPVRSPLDDFAGSHSDYGGSSGGGARDYAPSRLGQLGLLEGSSPIVSAASPAPSGGGSAAPGGRRKPKQDLSGPCCHCGVISSPQWRKGPKGKPILCNACGIRFLRTRSLGKTMPRKRRAPATSAAGASPDIKPSSSQAKRMKAEGPCFTEDDEQATDEMMVADDTVDEVRSRTVNPQVEHPHHGCVGRSRLAVAASACEAEAESELEQRASLPGSAALLLAATGSITAGGSNSDSGLGLLTSQGSGLPLAAGSRHILLGADGRLGLAVHNPSLALALALHSHHHQMQQQQQQPSSPAHVSSPLKAVGSPASTTCQLSYQHSGDHSAAVSASLPASPLMQGGSSYQAAGHHTGVSSLMASLQQQQQHGLHGPSPLSLMASAPLPAAAAAGGDIMQLVTHMASMVGSMAPAWDVVAAVNASSAGANGHHE